MRTITIDGDPYDGFNRNRRYHRNMAGLAVGVGANLLKRTYDRLTGPPNVKRSLATQERRIVKKAVKAAHELKNADDTTISVTTSQTAQFVLLNSTVQGTSGFNRTGRDIIMALLDMRLLLLLPETAGLSSDSIRTLVVYDTESRGAAPAAADIFQDATAGVRQCYSPVNMDNFGKGKRFRLLHDSLRSVDVYAPIVSGTTLTSVPYPRNVQMRIKKKLTSRVHYFNGSNTGTISDIDSGALYFIALSVFGSNVTIDGSSRILFRDV